MFKWLKQSVTPTVRAAEVAEETGDQEQEPEELVDPQETLRKQCSEQKSCMAFKDKLDTCNDRVNSRKKTAETCTEELIDYFHCVDGCVSKRLFSYLK